MTTLLLQNAGSALGGAFGPFGAVVGQLAGSLAGSAIDGALTGGRTLKTGPRLQAMPSMGSTEGAPIPRVYGRVRIGGELIWATRFQEVVTDTVRKQKTGGKGGSPKTVTRTYSYYGHFAVGLCEGPIAFVRRIWADGQLLDRAGLTIRIYNGGEDQQPDPLIIAKEGAENTPAFRGTAYVVFENFPLGAYGNRIPQFSFEVVRPLDGLGRMIRSINLIPGSGEFIYEPGTVIRSLGPGASASENRQDLTSASNWQASLDALQALCPNLANVALVCSWFGDDLNAASCTIAPRVERLDKATSGADWQVAGLTRPMARPVSLVDGIPAYGGTPSDLSVVHAIGNLKARGLSVTLYPFCMMDVPGGNALTDPWSGAGSQPAFPWRGRITVSPAPGRPQSPDGTAQADAAVAAFFGSCQPGHFNWDGTSVQCAAGEWSWRRMVLHYAALAQAAGGVDGFLIGSELVGLTRVQSAPGVFPAAARLASLASAVKALLGAGTTIVYGADWTEYGGYQPRPGELRFPLDPLWASPAIDAVGIDVYWPLTDWRDGPLHLDASEAPSLYDRDYLAARFAAGEDFDWYYASPADRDAQNRTPITDGLGKPWVWRAKDLVSWWSNPHVERVGGQELATPTAWVPRSKPIWFTEFGCPAVDKGPNGPNVFPDPKSSENALPPYSQGGRDDLVAIRCLEAVLGRMDPRLGGTDAANPLSNRYAGRMVDPDHITLWAWDARPYPAFPAMASVWADAANWQTGHWLTGRLESVPLDRLVAAILDDGEAPEADIALDGILDGYVLDRPLSARQALEPLASAFAFDMTSSGGRLRFLNRHGRVTVSLSEGDLVPGRSGDLVTLSRAQESELPREVKLTFTDSEFDYAKAAVNSRRLGTGSKRESLAELAVVTTRGQARRMAEIWLHDVWAARETATVTLRPGLIALEPGDVVTLPTGTGTRPFRIGRIKDQGARVIEAHSVDASVYELAAASLVPDAVAPPAALGKPWAVIVDLPVVSGSPPVLQALAVHADPWPGSMTVWRSADGASFSPVGSVDVPALMGRTIAAFGPGPLWRWDEANALVVTLAAGSLASGGDLDALSGAASLALCGPDGRWEVIGFARAELIGPKTWRLTRLLRGLGGSEALAARALSAGATVVMLDGALVPLVSGAEHVGEAWRWRIAPSARDHGDPSAVEIIASVPNTPLIPLSPTGLAAKRGPQGVTLSWIRRAREGGDGWGPSEIALDETSEAYGVTVLAGGVARRVLSASAPSVLYASADELADFGAPQAVLTLSVSQISPVNGPGAALLATIPVL
jgi:hypothetical protein